MLALNNLENTNNLFFGLAYGILICAFLYNLVFFLSNKEKSFLYYSMLQLTSMVLLIMITMPDAFFNIFKFLEPFTFLIINIVFILSILFNMEFLNTKKYSSKMHKFFILLVGLNIIDIFIILIMGHSVLYKYIHFYIYISFLLLSATIVFRQGYKPAKYYIFGWILLFIFVFISELQLIHINLVYLLHIGFPLESLIFSFALGYKIKQIELERQRSEQMVINQNKLASMGEMINNIAHQWRQPLSHLAYIMMNLKTAYKQDKLSQEYFEKKTNESNNQLEFMSKTIDNFRDFYKPTKEKKNFLISDAVQNVIDIMNPILKEKNINLKLHIQKDKEIYSYKNEYSQVVLNLLTNAKDALILNKIKEANIIITIFQEKGKSITTICDTAKGIKKENIDKIFEPYFTTKETGTGIGLYMSKTIIESHFKGTLNVNNTDSGACFTIKV